MVNMATLSEKRAALVAQLKEYQTRLKSGEVSDEDIEKVDGLIAEVEEVDQALRKSRNPEDLLNAIAIALHNDETKGE